MPQKNAKNPLNLFFIIAVSFIAIIGLLSMVLVYSPGRNQGAVPPEKFNNVNIKEGKIRKFKSYEELKTFLDEGMSGISSLYGLGGFAAVDGLARKDISNAEGWGAESEPSSAPTPMDYNLEMGGGDYSATNVQVAGVDEGDIVKTDGKYIYTISGSEIVIAEAYPAESLKIVSKIKLDSNPEGIYVNGNKLAVYGRDWKIKDSGILKDMGMPRRSYDYAYFKVFDLNDKSNPKEERTLNFEGSYTNSRLIGNYVYFVTTTSPYYYNFDEEIPVPLMIENGKIINVNPNVPSDKVCARCVSPDIYYFDIPYRSYNFTSVNAINIANSGEKANSKVYLLDGNQNSMFVSKNNIYITFAKRVSEEELTMDIAMDMLEKEIYPKIDKKDLEKIREIEKTKNYILSPQEKFAKIGAIIEKYENLLSEIGEDKLQKELAEKIKQKYEDISKELEKTVIHKIAINGASLEYKAAGEVPGTVLNQFSMDEEGKYFRIATTKNQMWSSFIEAENRESYNNLYVLDSEMKIVGKVEKLAKNERIYSVRFMQRRAYMVTFRQTDPLFVIDLKDPTNPKVLGKLKVPGFSSYLHPYDETTLIGLGKESDENGRIIGGVKLSLFDVSDVENPKELDKYVLGDSSSDSIAINEHKAFLFSKDKNLLVIPVRMQEDPIPIMRGISPESIERLMPSPMPPILQKTFNGAAVFSIDKYRFNLRGKIEHSDSSDSSGWYDYARGVNRSLYIKDILYTLSQKYIKANKLNDLSEAGKLELPVDNVYDYSGGGVLPK